MATRHTPELAELLPTYALGALDGPDLEALTDHLAEDCPECQRELERWRGDLESLAAALPPVAPAETSRARLLRAVGEPVAGGEPHAPRAPREAGRPVSVSGVPSRRRAAWAWLSIAALLLVAAGTFLAGQAARQEVARLAAERDRMAAQVAALDRQLATAQGESRRLARTLEIVSAPGMRPVVLAALGGRPGSGRTFLDPDSRRAVFVASGLAQLPAGRDYELWFIAGGKPVPAGVFGVDDHGNARLEVPNVAPAESIDAWAVTVEPKGGVPQPTGDMVLMG